MVNEGSYVTEIVYNGVVGTCNFELLVNPYTVELIDIDGDSPQVVKEGACVTLKVKVVSETELDLEPEDFIWAHAELGTEIEFGDRIKKTKDGKHIEVGFPPSLL